VRIVLSIVFVAVSLGFLAGIHVYLWRRLVRDSSFPAAWRRRLTGVLCALGASLVVAFVVGRYLSFGLGRIASWPAFLWLGVLFYALLSLLVIDVVRLAKYGVDRARRQSAAPADPQRRAFMARVTGGAAVAVAAGTAGVGVASALGEIEIVEVSIPMKRLPKAMDGFVIAQLTDLHAGFTLARPYVQGVVDRINTINADLIAVTGDLIDGVPHLLAPELAPLAALAAPHGVYFVTGNHEYLFDADAWVAEYRRLGMRVLRNERVEIRRGDAVFDLAGIEDYDAKRLSKTHAPDLAKAVAGRDHRRALVLLAHQPRQVRSARKHDVDLQLSGHTHGGQIWPWHYLVALQQGGLLAGLARRGDTWVYTSRGCGYWGPPLRVGAAPEITKVVLRAA